MGGVLMVARWLPVVWEMMKAAEELFPSAGFGPFRLKLIMDTVRLLRSVGKVKSDADFDEALEKSIGVAVKTLNEQPESWKRPQVPKEVEGDIKTK